MKLWMEQVVAGSLKDHAAETLKCAAMARSPLRLGKANHMQVVALSGASTVQSLAACKCPVL